MSIIGFGFVVLARGVGLCVVMFVSVLLEEHVVGGGVALSANGGIFPLVIVIVNLTLVLTV